MINCNSKKFPGDLSIISDKFICNESKLLIICKLYQEVVGSLVLIFYFMNSSELDINWAPFSVTYLSQYLGCLTNAHL